MSALEQYFLEREAANRIRDAHEFAERERLPVPTRGQVARWAILSLTLVGLAFLVSLI